MSWEARAYTDGRSLGPGGFALDDLLAKQEDAEWREEAAAARRMAREKGIDQAAIDRAVHAVRYDR